MAVSNGKGDTPTYCGCGRPVLARKVLVAMSHPVMRHLVVELIQADCHCWTPFPLDDPSLLENALQNPQLDAAVVDAADFPSMFHAVSSHIASERVVVVAPEPNHSYGAAARWNGAGGVVARDDLADELVTALDHAIGCAPLDVHQRSITKQQVSQFKT